MMRVDPREHELSPKNSRANNSMMFANKSSPLPESPTHRSKSISRIQQLSNSSSSPLRTSVSEPRALPVRTNGDQDYDDMLYDDDEDNGEEMVLYDDDNCAMDDDIILDNNDAQVFTRSEKLFDMGDDTRVSMTMQDIRKLYHAKCQVCID